MKGFTLVEVLLTLVLLGILAIAAVFLIPNMNHFRVSAAAKQVQSDIEYARLNATTTGQTSGVQFLDNGPYTVYQGSAATPLSNPLTRSNMVINLNRNYPGTSISGNYTVEFDRMGKPTTGGGGSLTLVNGNASKVISVTANTGKVTVQ